MKTLTPSNMSSINDKSEVLPFVSNHMQLIKKGFLVGSTLNIIMKFMSKEVKSRLTIHDGKRFDKLYDVLGYANVPKEYGGPTDYDLLTFGGEVQSSAQQLFEFIKNKWAVILKVQSYRKILNAGKNL
uniref:CRAL-TRIO domain-containing protein n=1 Tax=Megaselia scalaris TaxID=36166 RepID=T1GBZ6_MEGSC